MAKPPSSTPKIKDVAARAGVSVTTVSRVLNGHPYVRDGLRSRIDAAIEELGYSPSSIARGLVRSSTELIGVIVPDITASFFSTILGSIEQAASSRGYALLVSNIAEDSEKELSYLKLFKGLRVAGIIVMHEPTTPAVRRFVAAIGIPVVISSARPAGLRDVSVNIDDEAAAFDATAYLAGLGHRRIALIGGDAERLQTARMRRDGYERALEAARIPADPALVKVGDFKTQDGYRLMGELLEVEARPTAVFALSDDMAAGAMNRALDAGLRVPEELSVMGFDDSALASVTRPALTTVHQPIADIGSISVETLIRSIEGARPSSDGIILRHRIVERSSCARPRE
jgi:LacI family transcriptional regulator